MACTGHERTNLEETEQPRYKDTISIRDPGLKVDADKQLTDQTEHVSDEEEVASTEDVAAPTSDRLGNGTRQGPGRGDPLEVGRRTDFTVDGQDDRHGQREGEDARLVCKSESLDSL